MSNKPALLPEHAGCPNCGSTDGKRWRSYSGVELCTDCEWDYFSELNGRKLLDAAQQARQPVRATPATKCHVGGSILNPGNGLTRRPGGILQTPNRRDLAGVAVKGSPSQPPDDIRCRLKWKETLDSLVQPGYNSICLLCGHWFYGAAMSSCSRCGGACRLVTDHDMQLMGRHGQHLVEAEK